MHCSPSRSRVPGPSGLPCGRSALTECAPPSMSALHRACSAPRVSPRLPSPRLPAQARVPAGLSQCQSPGTHRVGAGERLEPKWYGPNNTMGRRGILLDGGPPGGAPGRDCHPLVGVGAPAHAAQPSRQGARWGRDPGCRSDLGACSAEIAQPGGIGSFQYLCTMQDLVKLSSCRRVPVHRAFRPGRGPHLAFLPARPSGLRAPEPAAPTPHLPAGTRLRAASGSASQAPLLPNPGSEPAGLAVFVSGGGSNFRAIHAACAAGAVRGRVAVVVTNAPSCGGAQFARAHGIPVLVYPGSKSAVGLSADQLVEALTKVPGVCVDSAHVFVFARGGCKAPRPGREKGEGGARGGEGAGGMEGRTPGGRGGPRAYVARTPRSSVEQCRRRSGVHALPHSILRRTMG